MRRWHVGHLLKIGIKQAILPLWFVVQIHVQWHVPMGSTVWWNRMNVFSSLLQAATTPRWNPAFCPCLTFLLYILWHPGIVCHPIIPTLLLAWPYLEVSYSCRNIAAPCLLYPPSMLSLSISNNLNSCSSPCSKLLTLCWKFLLNTFMPVFRATMGIVVEVKDEDDTCRGGGKAAI